MSHSRFIDACVDAVTPKLSGWVGFDQGSEDRAAGLIQASLLIDSTLLGLLRRDVVRTDVDEHLGYESEPKGFDLDLSAIANFVRAHDDGPRLKLLFQGSDAQDVEHDLSLAGLGGDPGTLRAVQPGWQMRDCWLATTHRLMLRMDTPAGAAAPTISAFQYDPQYSRSLVRLPVSGRAGEIGIVAVDLLNPFQPVLLVLLDDRERIVGSEWMPFPSLARGGLHSAEVNAVGTRGDPFHNLLAVSQKLAYRLRAHRTGGLDGRLRCRKVVVHADDATTAEPLYDRNLISFITDFLGVQIDVTGGSPNGGGALGMPKSQIARPLSGKADRQATLHIAADSIPTLHALMEPLAGVAGPLRPPAYICDMPYPDRSSWLVTPPLEPYAHCEARQLLPRIELPKPLSGSSVLHGPVAITSPLALTRMRPSVVFPIATDAPQPEKAMTGKTAVSAIVLGQGRREAPASLLQSLAQQVRFEKGEVLYGVESDVEAEAVRPVMESLFPKRHKLVMLDVHGASRRRQFQALARNAANEHLLLLDCDAVLHDTRTVGRLTGALADPLVGTASCRLIALANGGKDSGTGGYFLRGISLRQMPSLEFDLPETRRILDHDYWVVAAPLVAMAMRKTVLTQLPDSVAADAAGGLEDLAFGLDIITAGLSNLIIGDLAATFAGSQAQHLGYPIAMPWALDISVVEQIMHRSTGLQCL